MNPQKWKGKKIDIAKILYIRALSKLVEFEENKIINFTLTFYFPSCQHVYRRLDSQFYYWKCFEVSLFNLDGFWYT